MQHLAPFGGHYEEAGAKTLTKRNDGVFVAAG